MTEPDVCPSCRDPDETFTTYEGSPFDATIRDPDFTHECDDCGFRVYEYDGSFDY